MGSYDFDIIHTLEARGNVLLEILADRFGVCDAQMFREIQMACSQLKSLLKSKGIEYDELRPALVPSIERNEIAFGFDTTRIANGWYGREVMNLMLPLFEKESTHSIICGDWIYRGNSSALFDILVDNLKGDRERYKGPRDALYFVYINNLSNAMASRFHQELSRHQAYVGYLDMNFIGPVKACFSMTLVRAFIKHRNIILQEHEDDRDDEENVNLKGYDFEKFGYIIRSVPGLLYGLFLSYKIECPVFPGIERDGMFSLNAVCDQPAALHQLQVQIEDKKLEYLETKKTGSMKLADFLGLSAVEIAQKIKEKIMSNYIYSLARSKNGETIKFNIIIENGTIARTQCSLEYKPSEGLLRLITLY